MLILDGCNDPIYNIVLYPVKKAMTLIMIIAPILLIVSLTVIFVKGVFNPDDSKMPKKIINAGIAVLCIFFVSIIVNVVMAICGSSFKISECWNNATKNEQTQEYKDPTGKTEDDRKTLDTNNSGYE